jgi:isochorismate synthase
VAPSTTRPDSRSLDLRAPLSGSDVPAEARLGDSTLVAPVLLGSALPGRPIDLPALFEKLRAGGPGFAWFSPDGEVVAGFGAVARFAGSGPGRFRAARAWLDALAREAAPDGAGEAPSLLAVGGFSFTEGAAGSPAGFGDAAFFVPAEVWFSGGHGRQGRERWRRGDSGADALEQRAPLQRPRLPEWSEREWRDAVRAILGRIDEGALEKAVLARAVEIEAPRAVDPVRVLESLVPANSECFRFFVRPGNDTAFVGASPERLVARREKEAISDAVAGTAPGAALLESGKDRSEHAFVVRHIVEALAPLCEGVDAEPEPSLQRHRHLAHLKTRIAGRAREGAHVLDFVERVHPTPAVAGSPREAALAAIRALEPSHRGWYAGAVGWMRGDGLGDFTVGIRSAMIHDRRALLFAGAGIVAGSDPAAEWAETEVKLSVMREAIADAGR